MQLLQFNIFFYTKQLFYIYVKENFTFMKKTLVVFSTSIFLEIMQFVFAVGVTDITDVLTNTLGGIIGIVIFNMGNKVLKNKTITPFAKKAKKGPKTTYIYEIDRRKNENSAQNIIFMQYSVR